MKVKEKRKQRAYKATNADYNNAIKKAAKTNRKLAQHVEVFIQKFGKGDIYDFSAE